MNENVFALWAFGDAHVGTDLRHGRKSLWEALRASEQGGEEGGPPFHWDAAIDIGDMSGAQGLPADAEGEEVVRQFGALERHRREACYNVCGNHDRSGLHEPAAWWWQKWIDPLGEHTAHSGVEGNRRPFPIAGTWERYAFRVGNLLFLMMSDINEPTQTLGRGDLGGNPGGVVSGETFLWWRRMIESNPDSIVISVHHYMLKNTTVASGEWEGMRKDEMGRWRSGYHGYKPQGTPKGASYLYWVDNQPDAQAFESYLAEHPGATALWLGGHTHAHPDAMDGGKSHIETRWGTHFINVGSLTRCHGTLPNPPKSRLFTFTEGSRAVRIQCYMHTGEFLPQGWLGRAERVLALPRTFRRADLAAPLAPPL
ncbi:MAG: hypothetical protein BWZ10_00576 [candidate division BRC1 bacterium ADurb.BinA364]|nr:MAG: hypothetical protein BWZ10_00576 [candidate division BRC1 bacterium ADurb.BinA364]